MERPLISIITPSYNTGQYIGDCIASVIKQTYTNWEMIIVDDCSADNSVSVINSYAEKDPRIKCFKTDKGSGSATLPRNIGIQNAKGRFIAFLDSDDLWLPTKLEEQISLFENDQVGIVFSNYEKIDEGGTRSGRKITACDSLSYKKLLKGNVLGCLTVMYDTEKVGKKYFSKVGHEDFVVWLSILKQGYIAQNTNTIAALYRVRSNSLSANKMKAFAWTWNIYRNILELNFLLSCYYFMHYAIRAGVKYLK